ncbi:hypothetical protein K440DRAFT_643335 [Wilcoxina mikolae CBS 423.85]|nr:hypothetical protein K440DRAFT_643335 [Wilcoxina mikolae CBS 423.85]
MPRSRKSGKTGKNAASKPPAEPESEQVLTPRVEIVNDFPPSVRFLEAQIEKVDRQLANMPKSWKGGKTGNDTTSKPPSESESEQVHTPHVEIVDEFPPSVRFLEAEIEKVQEQLASHPAEIQKVREQLASHPLQEDIRPPPEQVHSSRFDYIGSSPLPSATGVKLPAILRPMMDNSPIQPVGNVPPGFVVVTEAEFDSHAGGFVTLKKVIANWSMMVDLQKLLSGRFGLSTWPQAIQLKCYLSLGSHGGETAVLNHPRSCWERLMMHSPYDHIYIQIKSGRNETEGSFIGGVLGRLSSLHNKSQCSQQIRSTGRRSADIKRAKSGTVFLNPAAVRLYLKMPAVMSMPVNAGGA